MSNDNEQTTNTSASNVESLLTPIQEVLDAWEDENFETCSEKCLFLLKKKKAALIGSQNSNLMSSIQRVLLQSWIQMEEYNKVQEWITTMSATTTTTTTTLQNNNNLLHHKDLGMYAQYRLEEYDKVISKVTSNGSNTSNGAGSSVLLEQHLLAQSYFHLNQPNPALKVYSEIASTNTNDNENDDHDVQAKMELLSNALAVVASTAIPFLPISESSGKNSTDATKWVEQSEQFIQNHSEYSDLAFNLGILQILESPPLSSNSSKNNNNNNKKTNWLQYAQDHVDDPDDLPSIETNLAWGQHFWYKDVEDISYTKLFSATTKSNSGGGGGTGTSAQAAVAKLNQTLLSLQQEEAFGGGAAAGGKSQKGNKNRSSSSNNNAIASFPTQPHPKWNPLQLRMYWYNRAVAQYKSGKFVECQESCQSIKKTLQGGTDNNNNSKGGNKKKKASPETLWWEARAEVLVAHAGIAQSSSSTAGGSGGGGGSSSSNSSGLLSKLEQKLEFLKGQPACAVLDHAIAHIQLHLYVLKQQQSNANPNSLTERKQIRKLLTSLPESIQSSPAVKATLEAIGDVEDDEGDKKAGKKNASTKSPEDQALNLFRKGQFQQAAALYQQCLPAPSKSNNDQLAHHLWYVQALSKSDQHEQADQVWNELQSKLNIDDAISTEDIDGEALEEKPLPRSAANAKNILGDASKDSNDTKAKQRSRESVLRQRAKKREAYLKQLEAKGEYNPDRPTKPNPERWIPKHERSRARRRNQHGNNRSAQGGGSQADALRLDAAARRAGTVPAGSGPSTANMKVSAVGSGKRRGKR